MTKTNANNDGAMRGLKIKTDQNQQRRARRNLANKASKNILKRHRKNLANKAGKNILKHHPQETTQSAKTGANTAKPNNDENTNTNNDRAMRDLKIKTDQNKPRRARAKLGE